MTWQDAWREGRTGWDAGASPPILGTLVTTGVLPEGLTLVPGCGSGYDVFTLAARDRPVIGIDIAPLAGERFEALRKERGIPREHAQISIGDFFAFEPPERASLLWDYTFFCALEPERRPSWGDKIDSLLADDGELWTLVFPMVDRGSPDGPPYTVNVDMYQAALQGRFAPAEVREVTESHPGREGAEKLVRWTRC